MTLEEMADNLQREYARGKIGQYLVDDIKVALRDFAKVQEVMGALLKMNCGVVMFHEAEKRYLKAHLNFDRTKMIEGKEMLDAAYPQVQATIKSTGLDTEQYLRTEKEDG